MASQKGAEQQLPEERGDQREDGVWGRVQMTLLRRGTCWMVVIMKIGGWPAGVDQGR